MSRAAWLLVTLLLAVSLAACGRDDDEGGGGGGGEAQASPGITDTSVKLGSSYPFSGPASAYKTIADAAKAHFDWVNEKGGVNGRKIEMITLDDGYDPARALTNARRLVERDKVFALFNTLGTANNVAIWDYANQQKVPQVYVATGASIFGKDPKHPYTIGWQPPYDGEARAYAEYLKQEKPQAKVAVLFQNDAFGEDLLGAFKAAIEGTEIEIVEEQPYEATDPSVATQMRRLAGSGADTLLNISTPKFAAQSIGALAKGDWKPLHILNSVSASETLVFAPVGFKPATGIISSAYLKNPEQEQFASDPAVTEYVEGLKKFAPKADPNEPFNVYGWAVASTMVEALRNMKEPTRDSLMEAINSMDFELPLAFPGIRVKTGEGDRFPLHQYVLQQYDGEKWEVVGDVVEGT